MNQAFARHFRYILGMPPNAESGIDKTDPRRIECVNCLHFEKAGTEIPCVNCWNPIGDEFVPKNKPKPRIFITCEFCKGRGEVVVPERDESPPEAPKVWQATWPFLFPP